MMKTGLSKQLMRKRLFSVVLSVVFIFMCTFIFVQFSRAVGETFSINVSSVKLSNLATTPITVTMSGGTFNGTVNPFFFVKDAQGSFVQDNSVQTLSLSNSATTVTFTINSTTVTDNKTYYIRLVDNSATYDYSAVGSISIGTPIITTSTVLSLANNYDQAVDMTIDANYTNFVEGVTQVKLVAGTTEQTITSVVNNSKQLKLTVPVGLTGNAATGTYYDVKITTGTETVTGSGLVLVRGTPSITFTTENSNQTLNQNYTDNSTITVTGTNTKFVQDQTTVRVLSGQSSVGTVTNIIVTGNGALTFKLGGGLAPNTYDIEVATGTEKSTKALTVLTATAALEDSSQVAFSSISQGYTSQLSLVFKGTNIKFNEQTLINLFDGTTAQSTDITSGNISGISIAAGSISFNLATGLDANAGGTDKTYEIRVTASSVTLKKSFTVKYPSVQTISYSGYALAVGSNIPAGYKKFQVSATGANTLFQSATKAYIYDAGNTLKQTQSAIAGVTSTSLSFYVDEGLADGTYKIKVDMDGNSTTTDDLLAEKTFTVTKPSIAVAQGITTPVTLLKTVQGTKTLTVTGINTHFSRITPIIKLIDGSGTNVTCTIGNVLVASDTQLTFDITPSTISSTGDYGLKVQTSENGIIDEIVTIPASDNKIKVSTTSAQIAPAVVFSHDEGVTSMVVTTQGITLDDSTSVKIDLNRDSDYADTGETLSNVQISALSNTVTFITPNDLTPGTYNVSVKDSSNVEVTTSFVFGKVDLSKDKFFVGYSQYTMAITGNNTLFNGETTVSLLDASQQVVAGATGAISNVTGTSLDVVLNAGLTAGTYTLKVNKASGTAYAEEPLIILPNPTTPTLGTITASSVVVNWSAVTGTTGYKLYRSTSQNSGYAAVYTGTATTYTDEALTDGTTYYYKVAATEGTAGESAQSSHVSATTLSLAPVFISAETSTDGTKVRVTFDKNMNSSTFGSAPSGFAVTTGVSNTANVVTAVNINADNKIIELTLTNTIYSNAVNIKVSYTAGTIASADGKALASFGVQTVTNKSTATNGAVSGDPVTVTVGTRAGRTHTNSSYVGAKIVNLPVSVNISQYTEGISAYSMDIVYNSGKIKPIGIVEYTTDNKNGIAVPASFIQGSSKISVSWSDTLKQVPNTTNKGVLFKIIFEVLEEFEKQNIETVIAAENVNFTLSSGASNNVTSIAGKIMYGMHGDANNDGFINSVDAAQIVRRTLGKSNTIDHIDLAVTNEEKQLRFILADIDYSGTITAVDASQVVRFILGKSNTLFK